MNRDDLILEIIEKVHEQSQDTARKVNEIQLEQARQGVVLNKNTDDLAEHMSRTANLEKRIAFYDSVAIVLTGLGGLTIFIIKVLPHVIHLFHQ